MTLALDTNVLVYATGIDDVQRQHLVLDLLEAIPADNIVLPVQVLAEFYRVLTRKTSFSRQEAAALTLSWESRYFVSDTNADVLQRSIDLAVRHYLAIWDAIVLASAAEANCELLLSEDMHHGFTWAGVTIVNPFATPPHPLLVLALGR